MNPEKRKVQQLKTPDYSIEENTPSVVSLFDTKAAFFCLDDAYESIHPRPNPPVPLEADVTLKFHAALRQAQILS
jgi:hypothetical protein